MAGNEDEENAESRGQDGSYKKHTNGPLSEKPLDIGLTDFDEMEWRCLRARGHDEERIQLILMRQYQEQRDSERKYNLWGMQGGNISLCARSCCEIQSPCTYPASFCPVHIQENEAESSRQSGPQSQEAQAESDEC